MLARFPRWQPSDASWLRSPRIIEFDPGDTLLPQAMQHAGAQAAGSYLAVLRKGGTPGWEDIPHLVIAGSLPVRHNSAEVLVLSGRARWHALRWRHLRHARWVVLRWECGLASLVALAALACHGVLRRLRYRGVHRLTDGSRQGWYISFAVSRPAPRCSARRYVPHALGMAGFLRQLSAAKVRHAVLRWFDALPALPPGEDLDLLVADDNLAQVEALLDAGPGVLPCDLYTVSGLPGTDRDGLPYFPPFLAQEILDTARPHPSGACVPDLKRHFLSLAYHVVYHKGLLSGLPLGDTPSANATNTPKTTSATPNAQPLAASGQQQAASEPRPTAGKPTSTQRAAGPAGVEHDYAARLAQLVDQLGWPLEPTLRSLDALLAEKGWRPPRDMLVRLSRRRPFLRTLLDGDRQTAAPPGLAVFLLRQAAVDAGACGRLIDLLRHEGFQVLATEPLDAARAHAVSRKLRGGNWGPGPWPANGGLPAVAVVVCDPEPIVPTRRQRKAFPELDNARLLRKQRLREAFNAGRPRWAQCNVVHASDNAREALDYLRWLMPDRVEDICRQAREVQRQFATAQPVIYSLSQYRRRAKAEIIVFRGRLAVKKTFKPQQQAYCQREAWALAHLSRQIPAVPPLWDAGSNYVIYPYYQDILRFRAGEGRLLPLAVARQAMDTLRQVYEAGYALIDAHPENLVLDPEHGLKLIDFEFLYRYRQRPASFEESYDIAGCPDDFDGPLPEGGGKCYARHWQPHIGLSLHSLLHDPPWLQHLKQGLFWLRTMPRLAGRRLKSFVQQASRGERPLPREVGIPAELPMVAGAQELRRAA
jgi:hypothetical protein